MISCLRVAEEVDERLVHVDEPSVLRRDVDRIPRRLEQVVILPLASRQGLAGLLDRCEHAVDARPESARARPCPPPGRAAMCPARERFAPRRESGGRYATRTRESRKSMNPRREDHQRRQKADHQVTHGRDARAVGIPRRPPHQGRRPARPAGLATRCIPPQSPRRAARPRTDGSRASPPDSVANTPAPVARVADAAELERELT